MFIGTQKTYGAWGDWGACEVTRLNKSCAKGKETRTRTCTPGRDGAGSVTDSCTKNDEKQTRDCNLGDCPGKEYKFV